MVGSSPLMVSQADTLAPGFLGWGYFPWQYKVDFVPFTVVPKGKIGLVTAKDGNQLPTGAILARHADCNNFQDFDKFLENGGQRGLQEQVIQAGNYSLNPWAVLVEVLPMTVVPIGHVGVVISYVGADGQDVTGEGFKHGNLVKKGQKGVCITPLDPNKYAINPYTQKIEIVQTTNLVLNWANARNETHKLDEKLSTIKVRSKDGFTFNLDVSQIIHIPAQDAPKVIKPNSPNQKAEYDMSIFLAGSIEMGSAENWQIKAEDVLKNYNLTIYNPRRDDWNGDWAQIENSPEFNHQVNWELNNLEKVNFIVMNLIPGTYSPISLNELGRFYQKDMIVCCPLGFWRRGNVQINCTRDRIPFYNDFDSMFGAMMTKLHNYKK